MFSQIVLSCRALFEREPGVVSAKQFGDHVRDLEPVQSKSSWLLQTLSMKDLVIDFMRNHPLRLRVVSKDADRYSIQFTGSATNLERRRMVRFFIRRLFHFVVENHPRTLMFLMTLMAFYVAIALGTARAETHFLEAESFAPSANGWKVVRNDQTRRASRVTSLWGADGPTNATASNTVSLTHAGTYRLWVRSIQVSH